MVLMPVTQYDGTTLLINPAKVLYVKPAPKNENNGAKTILVFQDGKSLILHDSFRDFEEGLATWQMLKERRFIVARKAAYESLNY
jgi:hypothetical protein